MNPSAVMLGRALVTLVSVALMGAGWMVANSSPVCSGGHYVGAALVLAGGLLLVRMIHVALSVDVSADA